MGPKLAARLQARRDMLAAEAAVTGCELSLWVLPALSDATRPLQNAWTRLLTQAGLRHIRVHDPTQGVEGR